jgi:Uma2 family endonuclease
VVVLVGGGPASPDVGQKTRSGPPQSQLLPHPLHQRASKRLQRQLEAYFEKSGRAEVFNAPIDVILTNHDVTQPDIVVVADRRSVTHRGIEAPPLLVVEVLSPSTEKFDRQVKARRFAALGVPHYSVLDPEARRVECYRNVSGTFELTSSADGDRSPASPDFEGLTIDLAAIWRQAAAGARWPGPVGVLPPCKRVLRSGPESWRTLRPCSCVRTAARRSSWRRTGGGIGLRAGVEDTPLHAAQ